jgi:5-methyltetrahydropteroyltriglutamate--homocysteine methyltransferase
MKRSTDRILTTITGSLARPDDLLDMMREKENGRPYDKDAFAKRARGAVIEAVRKECECGIDVPSDGEQSKSGFGSYQAERLAGFEPDPSPPPAGGGGQMAKEREAFPEYYDRYMKTAMFGAMLAPNVPMRCTGPVEYIGHAALQTDIDNFRAGLEGQKYEEAFFPSANALGLATRKNEYYKIQEDYLEACIDAMREEYRGIVDAGFLLQVDDPAMANLWGWSDLDPAERDKKIDARIEQINYMLRDLPADRIRFHTCYSINQGPSIFNLHLKDFIKPMLKVSAQAISFETMNPRHMHDYHTFEDVKLPEGKIIIPGMISHGANWVEHPELIAEFTINYAKLVGRENVMLGSDCGFASQAGAKEVDAKVAWAKLGALAEGARLATQKLWA